MNTPYKALSLMKEKIRKVLPLICPACYQPLLAGQLCSVCQGYLESIKDACPSCSRPDSYGTTCGGCLKKPPVWDFAHIEWQFDGLTRHLIHQFKYHHDMAAGHALVSIWLRNNNHLIKPDALIAVPMFHRKEYKKGFNQASWLAKRIAAQWQIPIWNGATRIRQTEALEGLTKQQRQKAIKGAFELKTQPPASVAIVDDVFTTGATAAELTRLLKKQGAQSVSVWALARTPL